MCIVNWIEKHSDGILGASPSFFVTCIAAYIAYQQYILARRKLKLDLYNLRFKIYAATIDLMGIAISTKREDYKNIADKEYKFRFHYLSEARFLINEKALATLEIICREARDLATAMGESLFVKEDLKRNEEDRKELNDKRKKLDILITNQIDALSKNSRVDLIFAPYLDFKKLLG